MADFSRTLNEAEWKIDDSWEMYIGDHGTIESTNLPILPGRPEPIAIYSIYPSDSTGNLPYTHKGTWTAGMTVSQYSLEYHQFTTTGVYKVRHIKYWLDEDFVYKALEMGITTITVKASFSGYIVYDTNGGETPTWQHLLRGDSFTSEPWALVCTVTSTVPSRNGYTFLGWAWSSGATSPELHGGDSFTAYMAYTYTPYTTVYAVWKKNTNMYAKHNGVWKDATAFAKQGGVWKQVSTAYGKQGGNWKN